MNNNSNDTDGKARIGITKEDYKRFVIDKVQDPALLDRIALSSVPAEVMCKVEWSTWMDFLANYESSTAPLREQMAMGVWGVDREIEHNVLATMKDVVINLLAEEIEHNEDEIRAIRHKQVDVEAMSQLDEVIPEFIRYVGLDHDDLLEVALKRALLYLHPGLLNS